MRNKFLFFSPSPRDIKEIKQPIVDLIYGRHDFIWFKYYPELQAYQYARNYFLNSPEKYDYLCIIPDDLQINENGLDQLFKELENPTIDLSVYPFSDGKNYPVLAGICNYSYLNTTDLQRICASISSVTLQNILEFKDLDDKIIKDRVIRCAYIGFSCQFIHRSVLEDINFDIMPELQIDSVFSNSLAKKKIPQFILKTARFTHYKNLSVNYKMSLSVNPDVIYVNVYKPHVIFVPREK